VSPPLVHIHYRRPPDGEEVFQQRLILDRDDLKVTLATDLDFDEPLRLDLAYVRNHSLFLDLRITVRTVESVASCRRAG
jgi:hypothetical protein